MQDFDKIREQAAELRTLEAKARDFLAAFQGHRACAYGDAVLAMLGNLDALLGQAERDAGLRNALLGYLRADGYTVLQPGFDVPRLADGPADDDAWSVGDLPEDLTGDDDPLDDGASEPLATVCPKCGSPLAVPGGPCRYVDCNTPAPPVITNDAGVDGAGDGGSSLPSAADRTMPLPGLDAAPSTAPAAPAVRTRTDVAKPVGEWAPTTKQVEDWAVELGRPAEQVTQLVALFKVTFASAPAQSRWGTSFVKWAKGQP